MKTLYKCSYCKRITDDINKIIRHKEVCKYNPENTLCNTCARYFNLDSLTLYVSFKKVSICTAIGFVEKKPFGCSCSFYIKDLHRIK